MAWKCIDIGDQLHLTRSGRSPADTLVKGDHKTAMPALIRTDLEQIGLCHAVEPDPVKPRVTMENLAGQCRHKRHVIGFSMGQALDRFCQIAIVNAHQPSAFRSDKFNGNGCAFAPANANRRDTALEPTLFQSVEQRHHDPRA